MSRWCTVLRPLSKGPYSFTTTTMRMKPKLPLPIIELSLSFVLAVATPPSDEPPGCRTAPPNQCDDALLQISSHVDTLLHDLGVGVHGVINHLGVPHAADIVCDISIAQNNPLQFHDVATSRGQLLR
ncbi:hypothetical protein OBBRIDRAFT_133983 [Obba rivulosa]|uniref:Uncharacterized protein n=1 Tax=Obba rivulosa TaxID=1052685 RepID=A0A8E2ATL8_9APHY|nr:hypothetical protein OBBRIDRAFT_133983 [Obba rivulosa]